MEFRWGMGDRHEKSRWGRESLEKQAPSPGALPPQTSNEVLLEEGPLTSLTGEMILVILSLQHTYQDLSKAAQSGLTFEESATSRTVLTVRSMTNEESCHLKHLRS